MILQENLCQLRLGYILQYLVKINVSLTVINVNKSDKFERSMPHSSLPDHLVLPQKFPTS